MIAWIDQIARTGKATRCTKRPFQGRTGAGASAW